MGGMKQAYTNTIHNGGKPIVAGKAAAGHWMMMCSYGAACTRKDCVYRQPKPGDASMQTDKLCLAFVGGVCTYGNKCFKIHPPPMEAEMIRERYKNIPCTRRPAEVGGMDCSMVCRMDS